MFGLNLTLVNKRGSRPSFKKYARLVSIVSYIPITMYELFCVLSKMSSYLPQNSPFINFAAVWKSLSLHYGILSNDMVTCRIVSSHYPRLIQYHIFFLSSNDTWFNAQNKDNQYFMKNTIGQRIYHLHGRLEVFVISHPDVNPCIQLKGRAW